MSDRVADIDYATWLTKDQAAEAIGVTPKTVERFVDDGKIQKAYWQPGGRGPTRVVYQPDDVAKLAAARQPGPLPPFLMPGPPAVPANGNGRPSSDPPEALARVPADPGMKSIPGDEVLWLLTTAMRVMSETSQTSTLYLNLQEAAAFTGLTVTFLRRMIKLGTLTAIKDRGWKIRKKDLEAL